MNIHVGTPAALARAMHARLGDLGVDGHTTLLAELPAPLHEFGIGIEPGPNGALLVGPALVPFLEGLAHAAHHTVTRRGAREAANAGRSLGVAARLIAHRLPPVSASCLPDLLDDDVDDLYTQCVWELRGVADRLTDRLAGLRAGEWEDPRHVATDVADIHDLALAWTAIMRRTVSRPDVAEAA